MRFSAARFLRKVASRRRYAVSSMVCVRCSGVVAEGPAIRGSYNGGGNGEVCVFVSDGGVGDRT